MSDIDVELIIDGTQKRIALRCYSFTLAFVLEDSDTKEKHEQSHKHVVTATSLDDLFKQVLAAKAVLLQNYSIGLPEHAMQPYLGCVKVRTHLVAPLDQTGRPAPGSLFDLFEWKCDHPCSLENAVATKLTQEEALRKKMAEHA